MLNLSDKELDRFSKEAAQEYEPGDVLGDRSWERLAIRMDRDLGHVSPNPLRHIRRFPFYYAPAMLVLLGVSYYFIRQGTKGSGGPPGLQAKAPAAVVQNPLSSQSPVYSDKSTLASSTATLADSADYAAGGSSAVAAARAGAGTSGTAAGAVGAAAGTSGTTAGGMNAVAGTGAAARVSGHAGTATTGNAGGMAARRNAGASVDEGASAAASAAVGAGFSAGTDFSGPSGRFGRSGQFGHRSGRHGAAGSHGAATQGATVYGTANSGKAADETGTGGIAERGTGTQGNDALENSTVSSQGASRPRELGRATMLGLQSTKKMANVDDSALRAFTLKSTAPQLIHNRGMHINRSLDFGVVAAPDFASVNSLAGDRPGSTLGLTVDYQFANRWYIGTGLLLDRRNYAAKGTDFHAPSDYFQNNGIHDRVELVKGSFEMLEIPLNLRYDFSISGSTLFFASTGLSSYLFASENNNYYYRPFFGAQVCKPISNPSESAYLFSALNLSMGVETGLSNSLSLLIAPYMKVPVRGIGVGQVQMSSVGINFSLRWAPVISRKRY